MALPIHMRNQEWLPALALAGVLALPLAGCFAGPESSDAPCVEDDECPEICSRIGECLLEANAITIRASWTVGGQSPSPTAPAACGQIDALEVSLESDGARDMPVIYYPVPCDLGQVYYDRMPNRLKRMRMSAADANGAILDVVILNIEEPASDFQVNFDLP